MEKKIPAVNVLVVLSGLPLAFVLAMTLDNAGWGLVGLVAPAVIYNFVAWALGRPSIENASPEVQEQDFKKALLAASLGLVVIVGGSYLKQFWLIGLAGLATTVAWWRHRTASGFRGTLAFIGVFVAVYGILAFVVQLILATRGIEAG